MAAGLHGLTFQSPARFVFGFGASTRLADEVRALGCERPLVVTKQSMVDRGDVAPALRSLDEGGVSFALYGGILPDAPIGLVDDAVELLKAAGCDMVIGLGGGSAMDMRFGVDCVGTPEMSLLSACLPQLCRRYGIPTWMAGL